MEAAFNKDFSYSFDEDIEEKEKKDSLWWWPFGANQE